jgi:diguanylate cyclase (GGDEF)-like protein
MAPVREDLLRCSFRSVAAFPMVVETRVVAVLILLAQERDFFDADEIELLEWLTADLSFALEDIQKSQRLKYLTYYDPLTGLPNLELFRDRLDQFIRSAKLEHGKVCVVVADLERFAHINDTLGRDAGDELLRRVGARFRESLIEPYALGRVGADTFAVASPIIDEIIASRLHDRMMEALKQPFNTDGREVSIAMQAGIALFPADGVDGTCVFKNAEVALKLAKSSGVRYMFHSSELNAQAAERLALEQQLRVAVDMQQFVLHYQPKVDMISGELIGAEALIRWQHPQRGLLHPTAFIALANETGLIVSMGSWAIDAVCAQQAAWISAGLHAVPIAVNLASAQFDNDDLLQIVSRALAAHSLHAKYLELELTESAVMSNSEVAAATLQGLRKLGVGLALDDFGTGYSSLAHLKRFPFNSVKIDRSFVIDITHNAEDAAIAVAIIAMAHSLKLKVVAEGIETQGQFNYLCAHGCDQMQGNLFSPAVAGDAFESDLRSGRRLRLPEPAPADVRTLLLVDDEPHICAALARMLRPDGYRILTANSGLEGLDLLSVNSVQVIISDQRMPGMSGTEFLNTVRQLYPETLRIILSGYTDLAVVTESVNRGAVFKFLTKPWDDDLLREQVRDAFRHDQPEPTH